MARSDLVIDLVEAQRRGDGARFRVLVEAMLARNAATNTISSLTDSLS